MGYVYILRSLKNSRFYIGSCIDIGKRFEQHNKGFVKSTKNLIPLKLEFYQRFNDAKAARQMEFKLKKFKSRKIIEEIIKDQIIKTEI
jgi:putative endonuclease